MSVLFLATAFDQVNRSRADSISSILSAIGHDVKIGDKLDGGTISKSVQELIAKSDGLISILSRRDELSDGGWGTHPWVIEEETWARAHEKYVLRLVEDGVSRIGGIAGDVEAIRFPHGQFEICIPRILTFAQYINNRINKQPALNPVVRRRSYSIVPTDAVEETWGLKVKSLIEEARMKAEMELFQDALELSNEAACLAPDCWRAQINRGVAMVHLGKYGEAEEAINDTIRMFSSSNTIVAKALHNKAWLFGVRDGIDNKESIQNRKEIYLEALALDNTRIFTRAMVLICMFLLNENEKARTFLEASIKWSGFHKALREELDALGGIGLEVVQQFPQWLRDLLYPTGNTLLGGKLT